MEHSFLEEIPYPALLINKDRMVVDMNLLAENAGMGKNMYCWDTFGKKASISEKDKTYFEENGGVPDEGIKCSFCLADKALKEQEEVVIDLIVGDDTYETHWKPVNNEQYIHYAFQK